MQGALRSVVVAALLTAAALSSGCATIVKGSKQNITLQTDPEGASCELTREGQIIGVVSPTPGSIEIEKDKDTIDVLCKKKGYKDAQEYLSASFQEWTLGNLLIGGLIGLAIDAGSGAATQYPPGVSIKLTPEKFNTTEERMDFYEKWRSDVIQNSTKAKIAAAKVCTGTQCEEMVRRIDEETERALASIEAQRNPTALAPNPGQPEASSTAVASVAPAGAAAAPDTASSANTSSDDRWYPSRGDRWQYRLLEGKKPLGTVTVEITEASNGRVRERITKAGSPGFSLEREVRAEFSTAGFQPAVQLPGGYQMIDLSPYFPPGSSFTPQTVVGKLPGEVFIPGVGMRRVTWETRVLGLEQVRVPAGQFEAWKVEAVTEVPTRLGLLKFTHAVWYSQSTTRPVKLALTAPVGHQSGYFLTESLELAAFEPAK